MTTLPKATTEDVGIETRQVFDPFEGKTVDISSNLVDRLEGRYAVICHEAAQRIRAMQSTHDALVKALEGARHHIDAALSLNEDNRLNLAVQGRALIRKIDTALARSKAQGE